MVWRRARRGFSCTAITMIHRYERVSSRAVESSTAERMKRFASSGERASCCSNTISLPLRSTACTAQSSVEVRELVRRAAQSERPSKEERTNLRRPIRAL